MDKKISLELFRFDVKTDYLPYFSKLTLKISLEKSLLNCLEMIQDSLYDYRYGAYGFKINGVVVFDFTLSVSELFKRFGAHWIIEPLNPHLVLKDLTIDIEPFLNKLKSLRELGLDALACDEVLNIFGDVDFKESSKNHLESQTLSDTFLLSFLPFAYATPLSVENPNYLGEAYFLLAGALYAKHKTHNILEAICQNGILNAQRLETYLFPHDKKFDLCIDELKMLVFRHCNTKEIQKFKSKILKRQ